METTDSAQTTRRGPLTESGATVVEYALLVALIAMVCIAAVVYFGTRSSDSLDRSGQSITSAG